MPTPSPDVVVIGAGIIGGSIAWRLAQSGLRVTMLDAGPMGGEASWAGAGMLAPGGEMETRDVWSDLGVQSLSLYPDFVDELERLSGTSIDFQQGGAAEIVFSAEEWPVVQRRAAAQRLPVRAEHARVHRTEAGRGQGDEHGRVLGDGGGQALAASQSGGDEVVGVLAVALRARQTRLQATERD